MTPTSRTLAYLRKNGWLAGVTERRLPRGFTTVDLFGWCDLVAIRADKPGVLGIQATSESNAATRWRKLLSPEIAPRLRVWIKAGNRAEVWGWRKVCGKWEPHRRPITLEDLANEAQDNP